MVKKGFSDKRCIKFSLVDRVHRDPLTVDSDACQRVLLQTNSRSRKAADYGIYFDDDYDYMQHLKLSDKSKVYWKDKIVERGGETPSIMLPSSMFMSEGMEVSTSSGLRTGDLSIIADPVEEELFGNDVEEGEIDDDFVQIAGGVLEEDEADGSDFNLSDLSDLDCVHFDAGDHSDETRSVFTDYSATSRGVLSTIDMDKLNDKFESLISEEYKEYMVGGLDVEDIHGAISENSERLLELSGDYQTSMNRGKVGMISEYVSLPTACTPLDDLSSSSSCDESISAPAVSKGDCITKLAGPSTRRNMPKKIGLRGKSDDKTKPASEKLDSEESKPDESSNKIDNKDANKLSCGIPVRKAYESKEEKRIRKRLVKQQRRERLLQRKLVSVPLAKHFTELQVRRAKDRMTSLQVISYA